MCLAHVALSVVPTTSNAATTRREAAINQQTRCTEVQLRPRWGCLCNANRILGARVAPLQLLLPMRLLCMRLTACQLARRKGNTCSDT